VVVDGDLAARFEECAARYGGRLAIHDEAGAWSYAEVDAAANRIAQELLAVLPGRDRPIVLLFENGAWYVAAILAGLKAGSFYVPFDPQQPVNRLRALFVESDAAVLLCDARLAELAQEIAPRETVVAVECVPCGGAANPGRAIAPDDPAYVLYTSGSSGEPKGVLQTHRNVLADMRRLTTDLRVTADDRFALLFLPWFSASIGPIFGALLNGASVHIYSLPGQGLAGLADWLRRQEISVCDMSLAVFRQLTDGGGGEARFPSIRLLGLGGEQVTRADFDRFRRHFAEGAVLQNGYGATETRTISQFLLTHETRFAGNIVPVGRPVAGKTVLLQDAEGRVAGPGEAGEIVVRSRYLSPGYWRRPELTREAFRDAGPGSEERTYRTGDVGVWLDEGLLLHLGRLDAQVKIRGHRVEPAEVEDALLRFAACREACVTAEAGSDGEARLVCYFVAAGDPPTVAAIREYLAGELPAYLIPRRFLLLESLPRLANGKVDIRSLPKRDDGRPSLEAPFVAPGDALERAIAELAEEVFGVATPGADDDFLDLGCDSLQSAEFLMRLERKLARAIPPAVFFRKPTIAGLAKAIREGGFVSSSACVIPIQPEGSRPPLFCLPAINGKAGNWFQLARLLGPDQPLYSLQARGLDGASEPHRTLPAMAAHFAGEIQRVRPGQTACLFGYSVAGLVAHECARQLVELGREVGPLILVDALDLGKYRRGWQFLRKVNTRLGRYLREAKAPGVRSNRAAAPAPTSVRAAFRQAVSEHVPQPYSGRAVYFQPSVSGFVFPQNRYAPWKALISGGLAVRTVTGDHQTLVHSDHIHELAKQLKEVLG
jgi:amino acid adenylation domain-containing protein